MSILGLKACEKMGLVKINRNDIRETCVNTVTALLEDALVEAYP